MELRELSTLQIIFVYNTYMKEDFPPDELKPLKSILDMMDKGIYECLGLYEDNEFLAYAFFVRNHKRKTLLLDYLAVCPQYRSGGYGSAFLEQMRTYYREENAVILECESERTAPDEEQRSIRRRRIAFYKRNGCHSTRTKAYLFQVEYDILCLPLCAEEVDAAVEIYALYGCMFPPAVFEKHAKVWNRNDRLGGVSAWEKDGWIERRSLTHALGIETETPKLISFVGAGGKTTTMYQLADELAEQGLKVLVTTTTHIRRPEHGLTALVEDIRQICKMEWEGNILTAGKPMKVRDGSRMGESLASDNQMADNQMADRAAAQAADGLDKLEMPAGLDDAAVVASLYDFVDVILVEADGAKGFPLKVPADYEPVLLPQTELVIACAGLDGIGQSFGAACFRMEQEGSWLRRAAGDTVAPDDVALILMDERGSRRYVSERPYKIVLNKADTEASREAAMRVVESLPLMLKPACVLTTYERE